MIQPTERRPSKEADREAAEEEGEGSAKSASTDERNPIDDSLVQRHKGESDLDRPTPDHLTVLAEIGETKGIHGLKIHDVTGRSTCLLAVGEDESLFVKEGDDSSLDSHTCSQTERGEKGKNDDQLEIWRKRTRPAARLTGRESSIEVLMQESSLEKSSSEHD